MLVSTLRLSVDVHCCCLVPHILFRFDLCFQEVSHISFHKHTNSYWLLLLCVLCVQASI